LYIFILHYFFIYIYI